MAIENRAFSGTETSLGNIVAGCGKKIHCGFMLVFVVFVWVAGRGVCLIIARMKLLPSMFPAKSLSCAVLLLLLAPRSEASLLVYEGFDYTANSTVTGSGGTGWTGAWAAFGTGSSTNVTPGSVTYSTLETTGNSSYVTTTSGTSGIARSLGTTFSDATTNTIYLSFTFNWDTGTRFFGLQLMNGTSSAIELNKFSGQTNFGIQAAGTGGAITQDTNNLAVVRIDFVAGGTDTVRLFLNPSSMGTEPGSATSTSSAASYTINGIRLATGFTSAPNTTAAATFDEIRIGTTWADVVPVPEPGVASLLLGSLGAVVLLARMRRRQA